MRCTAQQDTHPEQIVVGRGICCPRCKLPTRQYCTRKRTGRTLRYRKCPRCHYRCRTIEVLLVD
jgi:hypothetical protein